MLYVPDKANGDFSVIHRDEIEVKQKKRKTFLIKISKAVFNFFENIVPSRCFFLCFK